MSTLSFRHRAIAHLRDHLQVHTPMLPQSRIEDEHGNARFDAAIVGARSSNIHLASMYALTTAAIVALVGERPMTAEAHTAYRYAALAIAVVAIALFLVAQWMRRRAIIPLWIELRGDAIVHADDVESVHRAGGHRSAWLLAQHGFTKEALAAAARLRVRCFAANGDTIAECEPATSAAQRAA